MKYLIVNGDDFGASHGINRGIIEAHRQGILTSTSLLVTLPWSEEAAHLGRAVPALSVGLHVHFHRGGREPTLDRPEADSWRVELDRQCRRFEELMGSPPTHLDSHHNVHRDPRLLPHFLSVARHYGVPLREHSPVRYLSKFYGQWGGQTHLEQISVDSLLHLLKTDIQEGVTELSCHPGYVDPDFPSTYSIERETELQTLCAPSIRTSLAEQQIHLVAFRDLGSLAMAWPS
jgi:chitin disaccharide deacetylase